MSTEEVKAPTQPAEIWRCPLCNIRNPMNVLKCRACETAAPHATPEELAKAKEKEDAAKLAAIMAKPSGFSMSSSGFAFGSSATPAGSSSTGLSTGGFKFGASAPASSTDAPAAGGFKFTATPASDAPAAGGFKFGASSSASSSLIPEGGLKITAAVVPSSGVKRSAPSGSNSGSKRGAGFLTASSRAVYIAPDNGAAAAASDKAKAAAAPLKKKIEKKQGVALVVGSGDMSQLGLGRQTRERRFPALVKTLAEAKINVVDIGVGALHNLAVTDKGEVYSWGCNDDGAIGRATKEDASEMLPDKVEGLKGVRVVKVFCGASHSLALTNEGAVYSWGAYRDASGLVGFNTAEKRQMQAQLVEFPAGVKITHLAAGESHSLALDTDGNVWYWGDVFIGRRMTDRLKRERLSPRKVHFPPKPRKGSKAFASANLADWKIVKVFAGGYSSFAVGESGNVWVWGPNNYSQCGIPRDEDDETDIAVVMPTIVPFFRDNRLRVESVSAAAQYSVVLTEDGRVFGFGRTTDGRLGFGDPAKPAEPANKRASGDENVEQMTPKEIVALNPVNLSAEASWKQESPHVTLEMSPAVTTAMPDRVVSISTSDSHALAVTSAGRVLGWGNSDLSQIGYGEETVISAPYWIRSQQLTTIPRRAIAAGAGSQHSMILARSVE